MKWMLATVAFPSGGSPPLVSTFSGLIGDSHGLRLRQTYLCGEPVLYLYCWDKYICMKNMYCICIVETNIFVWLSCFVFVLLRQTYLCGDPVLYLYYIWRTYLYVSNLVFGQIKLPCLVGSWFIWQILHLAQSTMVQEAHSPHLDF